MCLYSVYATIEFRSASTILPIGCVKRRPASYTSNREPGTQHSWRDTLVSSSVGLTDQVGFSCINCNKLDKSFNYEKTQQLQS